MCLFGDVLVPVRYVFMLVFEDGDATLIDHTQ